MGQFYNQAMTTLARYATWKISVYGREHGIPHVHATGVDFRAAVAIDDGSVLVGELPASVHKEVKQWLLLNRLHALEVWRALNPT